ncbi:MAG TPA: hypothetical protein VHM19_19780, partial [Polyangiales bacterium]|nr:hypothetical protein [Polyangiales bacterium]
GSAVSANPGVNPSLTITALAERAMSFIPVKAPAGPPAKPAPQADPAPQSEPVPAAEAVKA